MTKSNYDFIGNATMLDTYLSEYWRPFTKHENDGATTTVNTEQYEALKETRMNLEGEILSMALGVEAIGSLLIANDIESIGVNEPTWSNLGYLMKLLGKNISSYHHILENVNHDIDNAVIKD